MSARKALRRGAAIGLAGAAMAAVAVVSSPTASAGTLAWCSVGAVPYTNQNTWVRSAPGFTTVLYTIPEGRGFRIGAGPAVADGMVWWFGHGNDTGNGWVPQQNLSCG